MPQRPGQPSVLRCPQISVGGEDLRGVATRALEPLMIAEKVGDAQIRHPMLAEPAPAPIAEQLAGPTQFEIALRDAESVRGVHHGLEARGRRVIAGFRIGDEDAVRLVGASPHPAAQLVELQRQRGVSFKEVVNQTLRQGLNQGVSRWRAEKFAVEARDMGQRPGLNYGNAGKLLEQLEGAAHR